MIELIERKFEKYIAIERDTISKQAKFYNSKLEVMKEWRDRELELYLYKNGKMLNLSIENPDKKKIKNCIDKANKIMDYISPTSFEIGYDTNYVYEKFFDEDVINDDKIAEKVENAINLLNKECAGILFAQIEKIKIHTPYTSQEDRNSMAYFSIRVFDKDSSGHAVSCSRKLMNIDEKIAKDAEEIAMKGKKPKMVKEGKYDVIFTPLAFANLLSYFSNFCSAFAVDAGYSFLVNKIGKKVANECITIYDSGIERDGIYSTKFDDEGVATRKTCIVKDGILKTYLHNSTTAKKHNTKTTANAGIISPSPWNVVLKEGEYSVEEMIEEVKNGLLITNLWYTRFHNYIKGDFSTVARDSAFYIRNGEIESAVKGIRISDNLERLFKNINALSKHKKQIYWWEMENPVFSTYALIKDVFITTV